MPIAPAPIRIDEDSASADGDPGIQLLTVRKNTAAATSGTDADYQPLITDTNGRLHVITGGTSVVDTELPAAAAMADTISRTLSTPQVGALLMLDNASNYVRAPGDVTGGQVVQGAVAQDAAVAGKPMLNGARASTALPTAMSTDGDSVFVWADLRGALIISPRPVATATLSNVSTSTASATLLASNTSRKGAVIYNDAATTLYINFGATASSTAFTYLLLTGETLEIPGANVLYTGAINGILASSTGTARVTELT